MTRSGLWSTGRAGLLAPHCDGRSCGVCGTVLDQTPADEGAEAGSAPSSAPAGRPARVVMIVPVVTPDLGPARARTRPISMRAGAWRGWSAAPQAAGV